MKPIASPLNIIDFALLEFEYKFVPPDEDSGVDLRQYFDDYELDIDFTINKSDSLQVFIKTSVNRGEKQLPGYSLQAEVACIFQFDENIQITEQERSSIEGFSTIYIALNSLRGFISQFTSSGPLGRYMFPSIDLNDLINKKKKLIGEPVTTGTGKTKVKKPRAKS